MSAINRLITSTANTAPGLALRKSIRKLMTVYYNAEVVNRLQAKVRPLKLQVAMNEQRRINLIIPEINFECFYGGYIAKFNLAKLLCDRGHKVRVITVDPCVYQVDEWKKHIANYQGLESIFDYIEVACCYFRGNKLTVNPADAFIATTWWTAYIANAAMEQLGREKFVYLIQEYEPFTFPMGSYYAMAHSSYDFPHFAAFSTQHLADYFTQHGIGDNSDQKDEHNHSIVFENAIITYSPNELNFAQRKNKRLLFYARPEAHAARNMFEIGYLALSQIIEEDGFDTDEGWEYFGIGTSHGDIDLPNGNKLKMIGKLSLQEYRNTLPDYDLGLSLMYTPHPSLLPLEMSAAGMKVVTSECLNKTHDSLQKISTNLIGAKPTIEGVKQGIKQALSEIDDYSQRAEGARVNWASNWNETFNEEFFQRLECWITH